MKFKRKNGKSDKNNQKRFGWYRRLTRGKHKMFKGGKQRINIHNVHLSVKN